jgi:hypothetical protein
MSKIRQNDVSAMLRTAVSALQENFAQKTLMLEGKPWKEEDVVQAFQNQVAALQASTAAHTAWLKAVSDQKAAYTTVIVPLLKALRAYVATQCGTGSQTYLAFGFAVPQRGKPSTETRSTALLQSRATRKARGTMGKKQRLAIKGVVRPVTAAPAATSPSAPSATTATAASLSSPRGANGVSH